MRQLFLSATILAAMLASSSPAAAWQGGNAFSLHFDGADDELVVPYSAGMDVGSAMTIEVWARPLSLPPPGMAAMLLRKWVDTWESKKLFVNGDGSIGGVFTGAFLYWSQVSSPPGTVTPGNWYHLVS